MKTSTGYAYFENRFPLIIIILSVLRLPFYTFSFNISIVYTENKLRTLCQIIFKSGQSFWTRNFYMTFNGSYYLNNLGRGSATEYLSDNFQIGQVLLDKKSFPLQCNQCSAFNSIMLTTLKGDHPRKIKISPANILTNDGTSAIPQT